MKRTNPNAKPERFSGSLVSNMLIAPAIVVGGGGCGADDEDDEAKDEEE